MDPSWLPWRVGRYPYRSIYAQADNGAAVLVGSMATPALAAMIVASHNNAIVDSYAVQYQPTY